MPLAGFDNYALTHCRRLSRMRARCCRVNASAAAQSEGRQMLHPTLRHTLAPGISCDPVDSSNPGMAERVPMKWPSGQYMRDTWASSSSNDTAAVEEQADMLNWRPSANDLVRPKARPDDLARESALEAELVNPEKSLTATISSSRAGEGERTFRYAPLSSGLDSCSRRWASTRSRRCRRPRSTGARPTTSPRHQSGPADRREVDLAWR